MKTFNHHLSRTASPDAPATAGASAHAGQHGPPATGQDDYPGHGGDHHDTGYRQQPGAARFSGAPTGRDALTDATQHAGSFQSQSFFPEGTGLSPALLATSGTPAGALLREEISDLLRACHPGAAETAPASPRGENRRAGVHVQACAFIAGKLRLIGRLLDKTRPPPDGAECVAMLELLAGSRAHVSAHLRQDPERAPEQEDQSIARQHAVERQLNLLIERLYLQAAGTQAPPGALFESRQLKARREELAYQQAQHQTLCLQALLDPAAILRIPAGSHAHGSPRRHYLLALGRMLAELPASRRAELLPQLLDCVKNLWPGSELDTLRLGGAARTLPGLTEFQTHTAIATIGLAVGLRSLFPPGQLDQLCTAPPAMHFDAQDWERETGRLLRGIGEFIRAELTTLLLDTRRLVLLRALLSLLPEAMQQEIGQAIHDTPADLTPAQPRQLVAEAGDTPASQAAARRRQAQLAGLIARRKAGAWKMLCGLHGDKACEALHMAAMHGNATETGALLMAVAPGRGGAFAPQQQQKTAAALPAAPGAGKYRSDPNRLDAHGRSALHHAVERGHVEVVRVLLAQAETDISLRCLQRRQPSGFWNIKEWNKGDTALDMALAKLGDPALPAHARADVIGIIDLLEQRRRQQTDPPAPPGRQSVRSAATGQDSHAAGHQQLYAMTMEQLQSEISRKEVRLIELENTPLSLRQATQTLAALLEQMEELRWRPGDHTDLLGQLGERVLHLREKILDLDSRLAQLALLKAELPLALRILGQRLDEAE